MRIVLLLSNVFVFLLLKKYIQYTNIQRNMDINFNKNEDHNKLLLSDLKEISDECADCVDPLTAAQFPVTLRLATYQTEQGAH